jgi:ABC transporter substrate binding protein
MPCGDGSLSQSSAARAQQPTMPVVGVVLVASPEASARFGGAIRKGLNEAGYVEGQNVTVEYHWLEGQYDRLPSLMADLVHRRVAVIAADTPAALAAKAVTTTVPIVFVTGGDPVRVGLVASLNRPDGNVTGVSFTSVELAAKQLGLLRELRPGAARIAVLVDPKFPTTERFVSEVRAAASAIGRQLIVLEVSREREGGPDQVGVAERTPVLVLDDPCPAAALVTGVDERVEQRASALGRDEVQRRFHKPCPFRKVRFAHIDGLTRQGSDGRRCLRTARLRASPAARPPRQSGAYPHR